MVTFLVCLRLMASRSHEFVTSTLDGLAPADYSCIHYFDSKFTVSQLQGICACTCGVLQLQRKLEEFSIL